jgi:hypothetical protein
MDEPNKKETEEFLKKLMIIQRRYANELKNSKTNRQSEVRDLLERMVAKGTTDAS